MPFVSACLVVTAVVSPRLLSRYLPGPVRDPPAPTKCQPNFSHAGGGGVAAAGGGGGSSSGEGGESDDYGNDFRSLSQGLSQSVLDGLGSLRMNGSSQEDDEMLQCSQDGGE